ncbi:hypothetical protein KXQ82_09025 [Mucilaginibacter sp. HMF5004]|uniref:hypothetical protein n=1 Tax=Mucilaginibacter rivuli TaxID=2857527 RepID=UPI001C5FDE2A|nr:hypothetical protein [Mucilaginibacter rivuli]MBW4889857.1 hypothetical protein [Mucilaginibacter rivuli]
MDQHLQDYFNAIRQQIIDSAIQKGMSATGKTLASLEVIPTENGYELQANSNIYFMEHGRGPTHSGATGGNPDLAEIIEDWLQAKGLNINPYAVANTIHKHGTRLYRAGGNSGVLSVPLNLDTLDDVFDKIASQYADQASAEIFDQLINFK